MHYRLMFSLCRRTSNSCRLPHGMLLRPGGVRPPDRQLRSRIKGRSVVAAVRLKPMAYRLYKNKKLGEQAVSLLRAQTRKAQALLDNYEQDPVTAIHRARQIFKRCRSLLQLVQEATPYAFAVEYGFFKDVGKQLAAARDNDAMRESMARLIRLPRDKHGTAIKLLSQWFERESLDMQTNVAENRLAVYRVLQSLQAADQRYRLLDFNELNRQHVLARLSMTRLKFRGRYRDAHLQESAAAYHDWRKVTKRLYDQLRLCEPLVGGPSRPDSRQVKVIGETLGLHQDAEVLWALFLKRAGSIPVNERKKVERLFDDWIAQYRLLANQQMIELMGGNPQDATLARHHLPDLKVV